MAKRSFICFVEQELGTFPLFFINALLEWILIIVLFIDGFLAFFANEFSNFFGLKIPCLLCTRIDHVLVHRDADFYYNDSICEAHKKEVSSMAYCHVHKKLSDIRKMCDGCLLSFATGRGSDCDTYKSLVGILHKDIDLFMDDDREIHMTLPAAGRKGEDAPAEKSSFQRCSCCGEALKVKTYSRGKSFGRQFSQAPTPSPRAPPFAALRNEENRGMELPHIRYTELKFSSDNESEIQDDEDVSRTAQLGGQSREDVKAATVPLLESEDINEDRTPTLARGNRFFGIPLSDSANNSPRWATRLSRKSPLERTEFASEPAEGNAPNEVDGDSILHHLKRQVRLDRKSLLELYMELDEERSASAVAANNAMAMITRLQAEKAAVQMEALQYQRMMEEQAEYDEEALQATNILLTKREEEIEALEAELEAYRTKYGILEGELYSVGSGEVDEDRHESKSSNSGEVDEGKHESKSSNSSYVERSECVSPSYSSPEGQISGETMHNEEQSSSPQNQIEEENTNKPKKTSRGRKNGFLGRLKNLDKKMRFAINDIAPSMESRTKNVNQKEEEIEQQSKGNLLSQLSHIHELVQSVQADDEFLKHDSGTNRSGSDKRKLLTEISERLQKLHHIANDDNDE